jgi:NAD+ synthase
MTAVAQVSLAALRLDAPATIVAICHSLREMLRASLRRRGLVVGLSGGVDSSVVAALAARAIGPDRVLALVMPETDSATESQTLALELARQLGIRAVVEDISAILSAAGCYRRRDEAIRSVVPEYGDGYRCKIVLPDLIGAPGYSVYHVVVRSPAGEERRVRLPLDAYLGVLAATNMKQRVRTMLEYSYADRYHYAVAGTPNRLEHDQGFFVKQGDGAADVKPIAHLYKTQVYQLAEQLGIPEAIRTRPPTTDTYSLEQSQEEFYFGLTLAQTDLCVHARDNEVPAEAVADAVGLTPEQVRRAFRMIDAKREAARYLHLPALLIEDPG